MSDLSVVVPNDLIVAVTFVLLAVSVGGLIFSIILTVAADARFVFLVPVIAANALVHTASLTRGK